jgi:hypothetical protein
MVLRGKHDRKRPRCGNDFVRWESLVSDTYVCLKHQHGGAGTGGVPNSKEGEAVRNGGPLNFRPLYKQFVYVLATELRLPPSPTL